MTNAWSYYYNYPPFPKVRVPNNVMETLGSLNFAQRVRCVELRQATKQKIKTKVWDIKRNCPVTYEMIYLCG